MAAIGNQIISFFMSILKVLTSLLPDCPFDPYIQALENSRLFEIMGMVNYIIPFYHFVNIATAWGGAIILWYIYSVVLRLGHVIQ